MVKAYEFDRISAGVITGDVGARVLRGQRAGSVHAGHVQVKVLGPSEPVEHGQHFAWVLDSKSVNFATNQFSFEILLTVMIGAGEMTTSCGIDVEIGSLKFLSRS